ncbi:hypothetical protein N7532_011951 [Penicillium argentinense]|uniref:Uncharacterized protein n=1 Tax=Penicillium argentinense TaxID=1131581 RepID=A0A9W9EJC3_9EURO|nr:uncharacterized protein N7532_011951 [Penicillium argentinense]KAJ5082908.1 hypothetical protein N7532_011951 [Penicillium argentinense]
MNLYRVAQRKQGNYTVKRESSLGHIQRQGALFPFSWSRPSQSISDLARLHITVGEPFELPVLMSDQSSRHFSINTARHTLIRLVAESLSYESDIAQYQKELGRFGQKKKPIVSKKTRPGSKAHTVEAEI